MICHLVQADIIHRTPGSPNGNFPEEGRRPRLGLLIPFVGQSAGQIAWDGPPSGETRPGFECQSEVGPGCSLGDVPDRTVVRSVATKIQQRGRG